MNSWDLNWVFQGQSMCFFYCYIKIAGSQSWSGSERSVSLTSLFYIWEIAAERGDVAEVS